MAVVLVLAFNFYFYFFLLSYTCVPSVISMTSLRMYGGALIVVIFVVTCC